MGGFRDRAHSAQCTQVTRKPALIQQIMDTLAGRGVARIVPNKSQQIAARRLEKKRYRPKIISTRDGGITYSPPGKRRAGRLKVQIMGTEFDHNIAHFIGHRLLRYSGVVLGHKEEGDPLEALKPHGAASRKSLKTTRNGTDTCTRELDGY